MLAPMMTTDDLHAFFDRGWNGHDVDLLMTFMAEDCVFESTAGPEACGTRHAGRERVRQAFARVFEVFPDARFGESAPLRRGRPRRLGVALHRHDRGGQDGRGGRLRSLHLHGRQDRAQELVFQDPHRLTGDV